MSFDADAFGEAFHRAVAEVTRIETRGRAVELVARAAERLDAVGATARKIPVVVWLSEPIAFTVPGRYLYMSRQLLGRGLSEAGVAFVLAHEIAHHALGHTEQVGELLDRGELCQHNPGLEIDADHEALELCERAGYGRDGAREWLDLAPVGGEALPPPHDRIAAALGQSASSFTVRRDALAALLVPRPQTLAAPRGFTATDMVVACGRCAVRFSPGQPCPRCGSARVADLRDPLVRRRFLRTYLKEPSGRKGLAERVAGGVMAAAGAALSGYFLGTGAGALAVLALGLVGVPATQLARWAREDERRSARPQRLELHPLAIALPPSGAETKITGAVVLRRPLRSPIARRECAGWHLTGVGPSGTIDDAALGVFDVFDAGRVAARVDAEHALVNLGPASGAMELRALEGALADVLRARGRIPDHASGALAETLLEEGDRVEVVGPTRPQIISDGRRGADEILLFADRPSVRLVARRG